MSAPQRLPVIFFGHGNPMNALADNVYTQGWRQICESFPKPRAVLCVSAHWYVPYTAVTAMQSPRTIHDFGGFPRELFEFQYPAPGSPEIAAEVGELLGSAVTLDESWGLDHGAWSVLCHCYPDADVPVVQLSIDETLTAQDHYRLGRSLAPLREQGILIVGSGNLVHNLHTYGWGRRVMEPYDWAVRFEQQAREWMLAGDHDPLINYEQLGKDAALSAPTPDHYLPLLYVLGAQLPGDQVTFPIEGVDGGSISMLTVQLG
ncbi:4,5-DOPA dioxygenase extradiol [Steroidobacter cummioxidans]|uniref:4,5-DOPA-extradiol-dioxygenase n=1 Tax=Steroidobacter cummioxidans TaxID=1803913 RepID=UPI0019D4A513|nr:4,5-DOPA dioxygenase extradiol [Steroidobacter cummioxidans]